MSNNKFPTVSISARISTAKHKELVTILDELGITTSTAIRIFVNAVVNSDGIPFDINGIPFDIKGK